MNRIKQLREERGMTQPELGKVINVQGAAMSKYENEKIPLTTQTIKILADFFEVSTDYLLGKSDDRESEQSEPEYTTHDERQLLDLYRNYVDNGFSSSTIEGLQTFFHECTFIFNELTYSEKKILKTFHYLNEDNQDIVIGKAKDLLREQEVAVAADTQPLRKASGK